MAHRPSSRSSGPAAPWALLWLGGVGMAAWLPLLLMDSQPWAQPQRPSLAATPPRPLPLAPLAAAPSPAGRPLAAARPVPPRTSSWFEGQEPLRPLQPFAPAEASGSSGLAAAEPADLEAHSTAVAGPASQALSGSVLLGGPLSLASLQEKPMVPAARIEKALRAQAADRLEAAPRHWRPTLRALVQGQERVQPAEVVRVPAPHLSTPEEYPMAVQPDGIAETPVVPSPRSKETLERWAERQSPDPEGGIRPVVVVLEPMAAEAGTKKAP